MNRGVSKMNPSKEVKETLYKLVNKTLERAMTFEKGIEENLESERKMKPRQMEVGGGMFADIMPTGDPKYMGELEEKLERQKDYVRRLKLSKDYIENMEVE
jgi:hypothetical protein